MMHICVLCTISLGLCMCTMYYFIRFVYDAYMCTMYYVLFHLVYL